jgi:hypothetical protein
VILHASPIIPPNESVEKVLLKVLPFPGRPIFKSASGSSIPASVAVIFSNSAYHNLCYLGYYQLGINGKELARYFGISRPSVSQAIKRGEKFAKEDDAKLLK